MAGAPRHVLGPGRRAVGAVVDSVSDVVALTTEQIKPAPAFGGAADAGHITGIATLGEGERARMLILLDVEELLSGAEVALVAEPASH
jgi:purine-binding chemotaxis protein CheW